MAEVELQDSYDSDSEADEEFEMLEVNSDSTQEVEEVFKLTEQTTAKLQTMSSEIMISIPFKDQANKYKIYLGLLDSGASASLADENFFKSSLVTKREGRGLTWKTQFGNFSTSKVADVTDLRLPQFTRTERLTQHSTYSTSKLTTTTRSSLEETSVRISESTSSTLKRCYFGTASK